MRKKIVFMASLVLAAGVQTAKAGGLLTNTNQNVAFLRNPSRDAAIGIDGVYTNPAGVAFLSDGLHLSINWQNAHQTRTVNTAYGPLFAGNVNNPAAPDAEGLAWHKFKGVADAPVLPSLQAAYNKDRWSFQFGFSVSGGGGKCEFDDGLGSFEGVVASIPAQLMAGNPTLQQLLTGDYSYDSYMRGRQYYFGFTLGSSYKLTDNLAVFGGLRVLYGNANYFGYVKNIALQQADGTAAPAPTFFAGLASQLSEGAGQAEAASETYAALGQAEQAAAYAAVAAENREKAQSMLGYAQATQDIELNCDQTGWGIAPVIGVDYKVGRLNLAAKYDFKVRMRLENKSANSPSAAAIEKLQKFADGNTVAEDSPALLTVGAQYEITDQWRVMAGYHHFFDVDTKQYTKDQLGDTNEYNFGTEYDVNKWLQVSGGFQKTNYDMEDSFMDDISFNVSSYTFGFGVGVKVSEKVKLNAAYFQTNYDTKDVKTAVGSIDVRNSYTRTNRVFGVGCDVTL